MDLSFVGSRFRFCMGEKILKGTLLDVLSTETADFAVFDIGEALPLNVNISYVEWFETQEQAEIFDLNKKKLGKLKCVT